MADSTDGMLEIELVYALPHEQLVESVRLGAGSTIAQALTLSGLPVRYPELASGAVAIGIFGRLAEPGTVLRNHDRIEFYRPIIADPKQTRRARGRQRKGSQR